jgi:2-dehydropantoate 2-reductase
MGAYQPSTLVDWLGGKELEIEAIWGKPLRQAKQAGISLPHLERL